LSRARSVSGSSPSTMASAVSPSTKVCRFLRGYYHMKSADWPSNRPFPLAGWTAEALAVMPTYYIMDRDLTMAETVAPEMPSAAQIATYPERVNDFDTGGVEI
jgi:hypothetical protein